MADMLNDGCRNYSGIPTGGIDATNRAQVRALTMRQRSEQELPELTKKLNEQGVLFSSNRHFAIVKEGNIVTLRKSQKENGYLPHVTEPRGIGILVRQDLLSVIEFIDREEHYYRESYPQRSEWS